jgi:pimeloyl-ACP methyl ester carboxylesterase
MTTSAATTRTLDLPDAAIAYDIAEVAASEHPVLLMIGQPMCADGFEALAAEISDRTVVRYDPRGLGRSTRSDGSELNDPELQAADLHALIAEIGGGEAVDIFASSGGAVTGLALVTAHAEDVRVLVAHEPPIFGVLPDAEIVAALSARNGQAYQDSGFGAGMAAFIQLVSHQGELTEEQLDQPLPIPAQYGLPTEDDGSRNDPLLSGASKPVTDYRPDVDALRAASTRIVVGVGETSGDVISGRAARALAELLGSEPVTFRGGHGGFAADEWGQPGDPARFAAQLTAALEG